MRIVITGAQGQLGKELQQVLQGHQLTLLDLPTFDLTHEDCGRLIVDAVPDAVIHAGAHTDVDGAERNPQLAMAINADGTERVARAAAQVGARLIYISTDYVFDGRGTRPYVETDQTNPVSAYGASKCAGEARALACCENTLVVRTAWLYGLQGKNFVKTILQLAAERPSLRVVADQEGCPTFAEDLARMIDRLVTHPIRGFLHVTNEGHCTWHEFAAEIVKLAGYRVPVQPITTEDMPRPAKRPAYSVLSSDRLHHLGFSMPSWQNGLQRFLKALPALSSMSSRT
ncbi:MAG TPA: dTDP-4-dehydrorhamnose reductase [Nitrospira sp.]|nr:dTDP-4-dehydrorhamnose reductase [Nitrospira sp.]HMX89987.1 dTDP-4-dehydrorhamnose reductase [Nitrospira sp.]HNA84822.1 dTDP-4-dehydrorhamnose reductase [Nitrospira sp.]HNE31116.1 dTDP-4-dehydrorhamnose reductase [Nitrospira sp.]HNG01577.1 dTDP-4-dehydrorhamnose reductase [Nitrospira sp.]